MLLTLAAEGLKARLTRENSSDDKNHHGSGHVGVSRLSTDPNLLELLKELTLETDDGDSSGVQ